MRECQKHLWLLLKDAPHQAWPRTSLIRACRLDSSSAKQATSSQPVGQQRVVVCVARSRLGVGGVGGRKKRARLEWIRCGFRQPGSVRVGAALFSFAPGAMAYRSSHRGRCGRDLPGGAVRQTGRKRRSMARTRAGQAVFWGRRENKLRSRPSTLSRTSQGPWAEPGWWRARGAAEQ